MARSTDDFSGNPWLTREDWVRGLEALVAPAADRLDEEAADLPLPGGAASYGDDAARLEAVARVMVGACLLAQATDGSRRLDRFRRALVVGIGPAGSGFWGWPQDYDQRVVEMASVALCLALAPAPLWEALSAEERSRVARWLESVNGVRLHTNNWVLFRLLVNAVLHRLGVPSERDRSREDWAVVDARYVGEGWFNDSEKGEAFDYYNAWGFHGYGLLVAWLHPALESGRGATVRERAAAFLAAHAALQAPEGLFLPFGRSLTYRFAALVFNGMCLLHGIGDLAAHRSALRRGLAYWSRRSIRDGGGLLTVGFGYPNHNIAENYTSPGGPYFGLHAFLPLALPGNHPFWEAEAGQAAAVSGDGGMQPLRVPRLIVVDDRGRGHHWAVSGGQRIAWPLRHEGEKYAKFAYSSRHGFQVSGGWQGLNRLGFDSSAAVSEDGTLWHLRERPAGGRLLDAGSVTSRWTVPGRVDVETIVSVVEGLQVRRHHLRVHRPLHWLEGGWSLPVPDGNGLDSDAWSQAQSPNDVWLAGFAGWFSAIASFSPVETGFTFVEPNLNVLHPRVAVPWVREHLEPGEHVRTRVVAGYGFSPTEWTHTWRRVVA